MIRGKLTAPVSASHQKPSFGVFGADVRLYEALSVKAVLICLA